MCGMEWNDKTGGWDTAPWCMVHQLTTGGVDTAPWCMVHQLLHHGSPPDTSGLVVSGKVTHNNLTARCFTVHLCFPKQNYYSFPIQ